MERERLDALVLRLPENVLLLSGWWPMIGASTLVFARESEAALLVPECYLEEVHSTVRQARVDTYPYGLLGAPDPMEALAAWLANEARGKKWTRIGYEGTFGLVAPSWNSAEFTPVTSATRALYENAFAGAELVDSTALIQRERQTKTPYEVAKIRLASEISAFGLAAFDGAVHIGTTGVDLAALVEHAIMTRGTGFGGASRVRGYAQVACGPRESAIGHRPNEISTRRRLDDGDVALLELGVVVDGYWADRTRVRVAGTPTQEQQRVFETVRRAKEAAIATLRPGVTTGDVDAAARAVVRDAGYADQFPHITGHGVGFGYHEFLLKLAPGGKDAIEEGMITTVEPGIYFEPAGGLRLEDDVLVTASGADILGPHLEELA
jgi:Xaa-Pro dipeptidase